MPTRRLLAPSVFLHYLKTDFRERHVSRDPAMGLVCCLSVLRAREVVKTITVYLFLSLAGAQQPPVLSLPAQITVPPPWHFLPLSQADLGLIFSNSSPVSFTQPLLMVAPAGAGSKAGIRASLGPYSVTQLVSSPLAPLSPPLSASLLSKAVERKRVGEKGESFRVRVLFHWYGNPAGGNCVTLHAFKETEEQKATCVTQPPMGLCVVSLTLLKDWFKSDLRGTLDQTQTHTFRHPHRHRHRGRRHKSSTSRSAGRVQLYYSSSGSVSSLKLLPPRCTEDKLQQSQKRLYYLGAVTVEEGSWRRNVTREEMGCSGGLEEEEQRLDSNVFIGYSRGPARAGRPIGVSVSLRSNFTGDLVVIRVKVKKGLISLLAQPSLTSDPWSVTLERSAGSKHDTISILCQRVDSHRGSHRPPTIQVACLSVDGLQRNFGVAMTVSAHWWVEYSGRNNVLPPHRGVATRFSFTDREIVGVAALTESSTIVNTAILTSQPVSLPVVVLAVERDGKASDVTTAVTCHSTNENIVKVSSDCSALFVDGSESGVGSTCVEVEFFLGTLSGTVCVSVWAPVVPLLVSLSDPVLNPIEGWSYYTESGCSPVFQRSTVQVLAQFAAQSSTERGQLAYMLGSPDLYVDMTELVREFLKVENPQVAGLAGQNYLIGFQPGVTALQVISSQWDGVLGSCDVIVTNDPVTPGDLSVQLVGGLGLSIKASPFHPSVLTATVTAHNTLHSHGQEASLSVWLQFSDETATLIPAFSGVPFSIHLSSLAESVVVVTPSQRIIAQGDGGGPLVKAELLVSTCKPVSKSSEELMPNLREVSSTRRLAKGSGWVRVNLDSDFRPMGSEEPDLETLDISEIIFEAEKDLYNSFGDGYIPNSSSGGYDDNNISVENELERAVLTQSHEDDGVNFSPGMERGSTAENGGGRQLEVGVGVGVGVVLSLLCLLVLLFLVNCLPCALRERERGRREREERDVSIGGGAVKRWRGEEDLETGEEREVIQSVVPSQ